MTSLPPPSTKKLGLVIDLGTGTGALGAAILAASPSVPGGMKNAPRAWRWCIAYGVVTPWRSESGAPKVSLVLPPAETRAGDIVIADIGIDRPERLARHDLQDRSLIF